MLPIAKHNDLVGWQYGIRLAERIAFSIPKSDQHLTVITAIAVVNHFLICERFFRLLV